MFWQLSYQIILYAVSLQRMIKIVEWRHSQMLTGVGATQKPEIFKVSVSVACYRVECQHPEAGFSKVGYYFVNSREEGSLEFS